MMLGATAAYAGEVNGRGGDTAGPAHARSICAFSGLNDLIDEAEPTRTQSYGTFLVLWGKDALPSPGFACNPTSGFGH